MGAGQGPHPAREIEEIGRVPRARLALLARHGQLLQAKLANGLQHAKSSFAIEAGFRSEQALFDELGSDIHDLCVQARIESSGHRLGSGEQIADRGRGRQDMLEVVEHQQ
jgi:hypothetical protein